jgi:hypothetical protein
MSIEWTEYSAGNYSRTIKRQWTTHEGLVTGGRYTREERVMSDVYADVSYCTVWNPETRETETVCLGHHFELCSTFGHATVDVDAATQATIDAVDAALAAKAEVARKLAAEKAAEKALVDAHNRVEHGKVMRVARGRKVPKGTVGRVFWMRDGRVGLALSDRKDARGYHADVAWVDAGYLVNNASLAA